MLFEDNSQVLGVVFLVRHGDRQGFYQDPKSYTPSNTAITALGTQEEFQLGNLLRQRYLNQSSPAFISGINTTIADASQIQARADAGGEGGVIFNSAVALLQGLFPPTSTFSDKLPNGTTVTAPFGGYQSVEPDNDISLEGWTSCGPFATATQAFYASPEFQQKANESAGFLNSLKQYLDGRSVSLVDMIYDFMNVQSIHDAEFSQRLPPSVLAQARDLANFHEYGVFSSPNLNGIGNIAGQTILPSILEGFAQIADPSNPLKILYQAISYKPFISLFNMTGVAQQNPKLAGIVEYAAVVALEVRSSSNGPVIRFNFKNGTADTDFGVFNLFGSSGDVPLATFVDRVSGVTINDTETWCTVCNNNVDRGCNEMAFAAHQAIEAQPLHPIGAGFLGAGMALAFVLILLICMYFFGFVRFGRRGKKIQQTSDSESSKSSLGKV
ncbi:phosphoglycerate mutase-like protein [Macrolepiota fuliginosa MF-IS2]|uniref:Phosphoglycerate mutase-like protein n=1 Tax=Macrolepiota fuliginosa MF-IS2 TaxID=1400762 RepID=A0A9P6CB72_9AGAR|nr:phosphoglycerate mutase-like protein [Macrolepiota fuliginosa MF-IS2]